MRPTRRGYGTIAVALVAIGFAAHSGPRSLNAVAGPAFVALGYAWVSLRRRDQPSVVRRKPAPGFPGETRTVELRAETGGRATVRDTIGDGLEQVAQAANSYTIELRERGPRTLGPAQVTERDAFGLLERKSTAGGETEALVYPVVEPLVPNQAFRGLVDRAGSPERDAFESLREYTPGDPLRNVHWKSSAKREPGELVVTEYATPDQGAVTLIAEAAAGRADAMASAAASIAVHLLDAGVAIEVLAPAGETDRHRGADARDEVLDLLARTGSGRVGADGDVRVRADADEVTVEMEGRQFPFADLRGDESDEPSDATSPEPEVTVP